MIDSAKEKPANSELWRECFPSVLVPADSVYLLFGELWIGSEERESLRCKLSPLHVKFIFPGHKD